MPQNVKPIDNSIVLIQDSSKKLKS